MIYSLIRDIWDFGLMMDFFYSVDLFIEQMQVYCYCYWVECVLNILYLFY